MTTHEITIRYNKELKIHEGKCPNCSHAYYGSRRREFVEAWKLEKEQRECHAETLLMQMLERKL